MRMMQTLKSNNVTMINAHEVKMAQEKGVSVLDVRTAKQYEKVSFRSCSYVVKEVCDVQQLFCAV